MWLATEAVGRGAVEAEAALRKMSPKNLARSKGVPSPDNLYRLARERIFAGDTASLEALEAASNGFEHAYMDIGAVRSLSGPVVNPAARLVRAALFELPELSGDVRAALMTAEYGDPRPLLPPMHGMQGCLRVDDASLARQELETVVEMDWELGSPSVGRNANGKLEVARRPTATLRSTLPPGVKLDIHGSVARVAGAAKFEVSDVVVRRASDSTP